MKIQTETLTYQTQGRCDIVDISVDVSGVVSRSGLQEGAALVFVVGSTAGLTTCEYEPGLEQDIRDFFEKLILEKKGYHHDATWGGRQRVFPFARVAVKTFSRCSFFQG